jgi:hypothetical protein
VLTEIMSNPPATTEGSKFLPLAQCYKQLNSSVGTFGTDTLVADTHAVESASPRYSGFLSRLTALGNRRDALAGTLKQELFDAEFNGQALPHNAGGQMSECTSILSQADQMANGG